MTSIKLIRTDWKTDKVKFLTPALSEEAARDRADRANPTFIVWLPGHEWPASFYCLGYVKEK